MTYNQFGELKAKSPDARFVNATRLTQDVRKVKSSTEVEYLKKACEITQKGVIAGWEALRAGMTEKELMAVIVSTMYQEGAEPGFVASALTVSAGPERYKVFNGVATDTVIQQGDFVMVDLGGCYNGYACDFIRQAFVGEPTKDQMELFDLAIKANDTAIAAIKPGVTGADVYEAALKVFEDAGLAQYNVMNIVGHGSGVEIHEIPWLGERDVVYTSDVVLEPGVCLCVEPVFAGVKDVAGTPDPEMKTGTPAIVEDVVAVTEKGCDNLTTLLSKELWIAS